jgi:AraC family transcriptional regulator
MNSAVLAIGTCEQTRQTATPASLSSMARLSEVALASTLLELLTVAQSKVELDRRAAQACLSSATALLLDNLERGGPKADESVSRGRLPRWQAKRLVTYIAENLDRPIGSENLTALTGSSASHFFRIFKATFGQTPFAYITSRRIERAQQMMLTTSHPLSQIALDCGLCDQSHLTRLFRRLVGTTPSEWRREYACRSSGSTPAPHVDHCGLGDGSNDGYHAPG